MKLNLQLSALFLLLAFALNAQDSLECGTTSEEQWTTLEHIQLQSVTANETFLQEPLQVPIQLHIIGASNGALGIDSAVVFNELEGVNSVFAEINITFVHCGQINYINNNDYLNFIKTEDEILCDMHDVPNVINIYYAPNIERLDGTSICGYAYNFDIKNRVFVDNGCAANGSTLTHELGHSFSLMHTHSTSYGSEYADGSNCISAGDLLCDTPADPRLSSALVNSSCQYTGNDLDGQGDPYMPDAENIMSYSRKECRTQFSAEQLSQMEFFFALEGGFLECGGEITTAVDDLATVAFRAFPNPGSASLFISNVPMGGTIKLFDFTGKTIWQTKVEAELSVIEVEAFRHLPNGVYAVAVFSGGKTYTRQVIRI